MIQFPCSECGKKLNVGESAAGKLATCPACKTKTRVPAELAEEDPPKKSARSTQEAKPSKPPAKSAISAKKSPPREVDEDEELEPVDEERDEEEEDEEPRRKKQPVKAKRRDEDDEDEDEDDEDAEARSGFTANRIRGVVALVMAAVIIIFGLTFEKFKNASKYEMAEYFQYGTPFCCVLGGLLVVSGVYYLIRG